jgi:hypothetical protein
MKELDKAMYAVIPCRVRFDTNLTANSKLLYGEITANFTDHKDYCECTDNYFANIYGTSVSSIQNWLLNLEEHDYIEREIVCKEGTKQIESRRIYVKRGIFGNG